MGLRSSAVAGSHAEQTALGYLLANGLRPVARNFRQRSGELDLVLLHGQTLVFVEVRYRASTAFTAPALTVDDYKQRKLIRTAALFLTRNPRFNNHTVRFDVVAVEGEQEPRCTWIRDAFRPGDSAL